MPHRAVVRLAWGLDHLGFNPAGTFLQLSSLSFDASTFDIWVPFLREGRCVVLPELTTIDAIQQAIDRYDVDSCG